MPKGRKKDLMARETFICLWSWLMGNCFSHMLEWIDIQNREFSILFMNKRNREWREKHLDLFKALDNISPKKAARYQQSLDYEKDCKKRCRSNLQKLCKDKILKQLRIEEIKESIKKYHYRFLEVPSSYLEKKNMHLNFKRPAAKPEEITLTEDDSQLIGESSMDRECKETEKDAVEKESDTKNETQQMEIDEEGMRILAKPVKRKTVDGHGVSFSATKQKLETPKIRGQILRECSRIGSQMTRHPVIDDMSFLRKINFSGPETEKSCDPQVERSIEIQIFKDGFPPVKEENAIFNVKSCDSLVEKSIKVEISGESCLPKWEDSTNFNNYNFSYKMEGGSSSLSSFDTTLDGNLLNEVESLCLSNCNFIQPMESNISSSDRRLNECLLSEAEDSCSFNNLPNYPDIQTIDWEEYSELMKYGIEEEMSSSNDEVVRQYHHLIKDEDPLWNIECHTECMQMEPSVPSIF